MVTSCDPINPYTQTETFGVSYNGGYKPDKSLQWIPPDTNIIDESAPDGTFMPPPLMPPSNMLMQTCEGRRYDIRTGGVPKRDMQFDDFTESQEVSQVKPPPVIEAEFLAAAAEASADPIVPGSNVKDEGWNNLAVLTVVLVVVLIALRSS